jgi:hypothetical protein
VLDPDLLPRAAVLVQVAALQAAAGLFLQPAQCQPLYVREQVALTTEQRRQQVRG